MKRKNGEPLPRMSDGTLPRVAWPGAYPIVYIMGDGEVLCPDCANGENGSEASEDAEDRDWRIEGAEVHWEGPPLTCVHCNAEIASAYGDPDDKETGGDFESGDPEWDEAMEGWGGDDDDDDDGEGA